MIEPSRPADGSRVHGTHFCLVKGRSHWEDYSNVIQPPRAVDQTTIRSHVFEKGLLLGMEVQVENSLKHPIRDWLVCGPASCLAQLLGYVKQNHRNCVAGRL